MFGITITPNKGFQTNSTMKQTLLISFLLIISITTLGEKKKTTSDLLCTGEWQAIIKDNGPIYKLTLSFTKTQQNYYLEYNTKAGKKNYSKISDYYLSETPDTTFTKKKVGKVTEGKYIIAQKDGVYEIITLTSTTLKIKRIDGAILEYKKKEKDADNTSKK